MRALGIDFGEKRIGLALSDPEGRLALPLRTLARRNDRQAIDEIAAIAREEGVEALVVGEPRRPSDGAATDAARRVRSFGARLAEATGLAIEWVDESMSSIEAEARLAEAGVPHERRRERRDAVAAQILLEEALERWRRRASSTPQPPEEPRSE